MPLFIDDLVGQFCEAEDRDAPLGNICWAPIHYVYDNKELWRPDSLDMSGTVAKSFGIKPAGSDAYRRRMPISIPHLKTDEEFPVVRSKKRPVIVVSGGAPDRGLRKSRAATGYQDLSIVVPVFSLQDKATGALKLAQADIDNIRLLKYPEFFYLPRERPFTAIGVAQLARITSVPSAHLERSSYRLGALPRDLFTDAVRWVLFRENGQTYAAYQGQLRDQA